MKEAATTRQGTTRPATMGEPHPDWSMTTHRGSEPLARPRAVRIVRFEALSERHFGIQVHDPHLARAAPGQFAMLWVPGVDEVPMGISETDEKEGTAWFLVDRVGDCTTAMGRMREGERIGVRGPYGRPFELPTGGRVLLVGGGTGTAPLLRTVHAAHALGTKVDVVLGAREKQLLVWEERFRRSADGTYPCTDDGSHGFHGFTTQQTEALLESGETYDLILTCGPEKMMHKVAAIAARWKIPCQVSLERYMKCGIGVCGSCVMGEGIRACVEGPCFPAAELEAVPDFGHYHRGPDGSKHPY